MRRTSVAGRRAHPTVAAAAPASTAPAADGFVAAVGADPRLPASTGTPPPLPLTVPPLGLLARPKP